MRKNHFFVVLGFTLALALSGCQNRPQKTSGDQRGIGQGDRTEIVFLTRNAPTTYYTNREDQSAGLEHDLAVQFAQYMKLTPRFEVVEGIDEVMEGLVSGKGDIAAAGLTLTDYRVQQFLPGPTYQEIRQEVVCHQKIRLKKKEDLVGKRVEVIASSSYEDELQKLKKSFPALVWKSETELSTEQILERVWKGEVDCTVADSNIVAVNRRYMPQLTVPLALTEVQPLVWYLRKDEQGLQTELQAWMEKFQKRGGLKAALERNYGFVPKFDFYDTKKFLQRIKGRLPKYVPLFKKAGAEHGYPWTFLAVVSYQESHWNPKAKSPTGVRGMMMLTQQTAKSLGVTNRLDPEQSIMGGAKYFSKMTKKIPEHVKEPDRYFLALAAYNVGFGHLKDAQKLAIDLGKNPNVWADVREILPLLSQKKYFRRVRHGYARGNEPVIYVDRIRNYFDILLREMKIKKGG